MNQDTPATPAPHEPTEPTLEHHTVQDPDAAQVVREHAAHATKLAAPAETDAARPNPADRLLRFFEYEHLPPHLKDVSRPVASIAKHMAATLPQDAETTAGLRKLLEAKDCFVRAALTRTLP